jgi:hypothetical protein
MGNVASAAELAAQAVVDPGQKSPQGGVGGCPVNHEGPKMSTMPKGHPTIKADGGGGCPVDHVSCNLDPKE